VSRPIRVLELRSVRGTGGGPEKTILLGAARSDPSRVAVTVCYVRDVHDHVFAIGERARALGVDYVEPVEHGSFDPRIWSHLRALVASRGIDIVHAHDYKTDILTWLLARRTGVIPLSTAHGWTGHSARERWLYYPADKYVLARYPRVIAVSTDVRRELLRVGAREDRVTVVLNGIDTSTNRRDPARVAAARRAFGLTSDVTAIVAVGRLEPQKRFDLLLRAFVGLSARRPELRLLIAGDGGLRQDLAAWRERLGLVRTSVLLGHVSDLSDVYHAADLFVQSADYEGTPNAVLEAMAFEVPIVATDAGGTSELVRDQIEGLIVPCGDERALAEAIESVLTDRAAARNRAEKARARVETELAFDTRMRRVEAIYEALADGRRVSSNSAKSSIIG
jgi:glycosyltransferase involved in cell wall biosynthesis